LSKEFEKVEFTGGNVEMTKIECDYESEKEYILMEGEEK